MSLSRLETKPLLIPLASEIPIPPISVSPAGVVKAIRYAIDLMGADHVALGSDYDGTVTTTLDSSELAILTQTMMDEGFSKEEIRKVMGDNVKRFLLANLPE